MNGSSLRSGQRPNGRPRARGQALAEFVLVAPLLFLVILAIIESGRFIFYSELINNATREGARYAIVHGSNSSCPSGPPPPFETNPCDPTGANVMTATRSAMLDLVATGELFASAPVWTNHNGRGQHVTVAVDYTFDPIIKVVTGIEILPSFTVAAESTLVINN